MAAETCADCTATYAVGVEQCPQCGSTERAEQPTGGAVLPSVTVACANTGCRHEGLARRVLLRTAAQGVLELPHLVCAGCGYDMPTVTPWPPVTEPEEEQMPKITVHGGASNAADPEEQPADAESVEGSEDVSAGSSSSTSSERDSSSPETSEQPSPSPARTTASRSKKVATGKAPSAPSTDGGPESGGSETSAADK
ncbi:hypothetical protein [Streptomyces sp. NPDC059759]|uniref:hypothetical protein n=1 Tax=Streptomyces sp. NPDC059759 TaxID=3346936 RepID=UPI00364ABF2C